MSKEIPSFSIKTLFENKDSYVIPIYQRNYIWGLGEITQLIQDICDYAFDPDKSKTNYYIGTLVVYERNIDGEIIFETIDGQQRLTTLNILLNALHREFNIDNKIDYQLNLTFDSRKKSTETLAVINNQNDGKVAFISNKEYNIQIKQRYFDAEKVLKRFLDTKEREQIFYSYLTNNVNIVRVSVPEETDLNHYFEIMNNRGEQLEKHEILKANMLEILKDEPEIGFTFNTIWEACADMERYVQYGFTTTQRDHIFTNDNWNTLKHDKIEDIAEHVFANVSNEESFKELTIETIIDYKGSFETNKNEKEDAPERFSSVINFSNFLLHVLRIQKETNIALDDKRLIDSFNVSLNDKTSNLQFVKDFGFNLLKAKHLFDKYIIKREFIREKDQWCLKKLKWYAGNKVSYVNVVENDEALNKELLMLLSMFHVSTPTLVYKHWLNAALYYLFYQTEINVNFYKTYLQNLAQSYLNDRYVANGEPIDYFNIIFKNKAISVNKTSSNFDFKKLDTGTSVENFVFNYLDYILWKENVESSSSFDFTFRSSVEHYYPQNPISKEHTIDKSIYDLFGNLCLISSSKNSRLSNHMPTAKKDYYYKVGADSLKQQLMMSETNNWSENEIISHTEAMKSKLKNFNYAQ